MDCTRLSSLFSARLDHELSGREEAAFDGHLAGCPECRRQWRLFQATLERLHNLPPQPPPPDLLPGILAAVRGERRELVESSWWSRLLAWWSRQDFSVSVPTAAATVATAMVLAVLVKNSMLPLPFAGPADEIAGQSSQRAGAVAGLAGERPRLPLPDATLAATSPRGYVPGFASGLSSPLLSDYPYDTMPARQPSQPGPGLRPDVLVVFHASDAGEATGSAGAAGNDEVESLLQACNAQSSWRVSYPRRGMMVVDLPPCELPLLREMLAGKSAAIAPVAALSPDFGQGRETVKVAIRFQ